ncbi:RT1 class I histocompatibility antigen, AA alpha chain-like [Mustelus asterias]
MFGLTVLVLLCGGAYAGSHSLRYFFTSMTPIPGLPQFVIVGYVDDAEFVLYDSNRKEMIPRQCWMAESEGPEYWKQQTQTAREWEQALTISIQNIMRRTNQTDGTHTYQLMYGCEMRDDGSTGGFEQFGWDGKDYVNFDKDHMVWVTRVNWGEVSKNKWDQAPGFNKHVKRYLEQECIESLKKYLKDGEQELRPCE